MAITLNTTLRNARSTAIVTEAGSGAKLAVYTAGYASKLYESDCAATLGIVSAGALTLNAVASATAIAGGVAAVARLFKSDGTTMVIEGLTVGTTGTNNIVITNTTIAVNDVVTTSSGTITEGNA